MPQNPRMSPTRTPASMRMRSSLVAGIIEAPESFFHQIPHETVDKEERNGIEEVEGKHEVVRLDMHKSNVA